MSYGVPCPKKKKVVGVRFGDGLLLTASVVEDAHRHRSGTTRPFYRTVADITLPSGDIFAVPNNLYIVGTMNSADKSISLIDTALRRRFEFVEYVPNLTLIADEKLKTVLEKLNSGIAVELNSTDLLVGHSYFMNKSQDDICEIMNRSIIPLLYEYFFDNHKKVEAQVKKAVEGMDVEIESSTIGRIKLKKKGSN